MAFIELLILLAGLGIWRRHDRRKEERALQNIPRPRLDVDPREVDAVREMLSGGAKKEP